MLSLFSLRGSRRLSTDDQSAPVMPGSRCCGGLDSSEGATGDAQAGSTGPGIGAPIPSLVGGFDCLSEGGIIMGCSSMRLTFGNLYMYK